MVSYEHVLPCGSVVLLKGGNKRLMIIGYQRMRPEGKEVYDYCACLYPEGFAGLKYCTVFNHDQIDRVIAIGLQNQPQAALAQQLQAFIARREGSGA